MRIPPMVAAACLAAAASPALAGPAARSHEAVVYLTAHGFSPPALTIARDDRVRFTVRDHRNHQIAKLSGSSSGDVAPNVLEGQGASVTLMPQEPGAFTYVDRIGAVRSEFRLIIRR